MLIFFYGIGCVIEMCAANNWCKNSKQPRDTRCMQACKSRHALLLYAKLVSRIFLGLRFLVPSCWHIPSEVDDFQWFSFSQRWAYVSSLEDFNMSVHPDTFPRSALTVMIWDAPLSRMGVTTRMTNCCIFQATGGSQAKPALAYWKHLFFLLSFLSFLTFRKEVYVKQWSNQTVLIFKFTTCCSQNSILYFITYIK